MLRRLALVVVVAGVLVACGGGGDEERPARTIAILRALPTTNEAAEVAFLDVLAEAGWVEGENLTVRGDGEVHATPDEATAAVAAWVDEGVDLVVALSSTGAAAADDAAPDVPVLFLSTDPTAIGLVGDERTPDGHLTGGTFRVPADRTLDVAMRALGGLDRVGLLWPIDDPAAEPVVDDVERAAGGLDVEVVDRPFTDDVDAGIGIAELVDQDVDAILLANAPATVRSFDVIEDAINAARIPALANTTNDFALLTLQPDTLEVYRQLGRQAVRLLSGTAVADVPVEDPAAYRIVVDRGVADRLGVDVPAEVLELADEVRG